VQRAQHTPAFMLHQRPWGDSGRVIELFSRDHGRLSVFAHGVRGTQARLAGVLQPFVPLLVSWAGRGEAPRLTGAEIHHARRPGEAMPRARLLSAWYVTELVLTLTARHDPQPELYEHYAQALAALRTVTGQERTLRLFEKRLLDVLGYGVADIDDAQFEDSSGLEKLRPVLRAAIARCLEGRPLQTRAVAVSLREFGHAL